MVRLPVQPFFSLSATRSLTYSFRRLFSKTEVQILILGLDHAGKTTLLEQMKGIFQRTNGIPLDKIPPTVGLNIGRMDINNCRVIFWDLGGQARLRSIWDNYYAEAHGLMFVVDAADPTRFEEAKRALDSLLCHPELAGIPVLLCANKQDLHEARTVKEIHQVFMSKQPQSADAPGKANASLASTGSTGANASLNAAGNQHSGAASQELRQRQIKLQAVRYVACVICVHVVESNVTGMGSI